CHAAAPSRAARDWDGLMGLYALLLSVPANPAVALNRAVAVGERDGPAGLLEAVDSLPAQPRSHLWHAARADALRRLGRPEEARHELLTAGGLAPSGPERRLLAPRAHAPV